MSMPELSKLLNCLPLSTDPTDFLLRPANEGPASAMIPATLYGNVLGQKVECTIKANGDVLFAPPPQEIHTYVRFAFVGVSSHICPPIEELKTKILSSSTTNIRSHYFTLPEDMQEKIVTMMRTLFPSYGALQISREGKDLLIKSERGSASIMYEGEAFRKVFTSWVFVYKLASMQPSEKRPKIARVLCVEEPETHLHPSLQSTFITLLREITARHQIQLIMTTNSSTVIRSFSPENVVVLRKSGQIVDPRANFHDTVSLLGLLETRRPIILLEGKDDGPFVERVSLELGWFQKLSQVVLHRLGGQSASTAVRVLKRENPAARVLILRDKGFEGNPPLSTEEAEIVYWTLPCIESYCFVTYYALYPDQLARDFKANKKEWLQDYVHGYQTKNRKKGGLCDYTTMMKNWNRAKDVVKKPLPADGEQIALEELKAVAKVVRGHSWERRVFSGSGAHPKPSIAEIVSHNREDLRSVISQLFAPFK